MLSEILMIIDIQKAISSIVKNEESIPNSGNSTTLHKIRRMKKITRQNRNNKIRKLSGQLNQIFEQLSAVNLFEICIIDTYIMIIFVELIVFVLYIVCLIFICLRSVIPVPIISIVPYIVDCQILPLFPTVSWKYFE